MLVVVMTALAPSAPRAYLWVWGASLLVLGVGSLVVSPHFGIGDHVARDTLAGIETNGWHGLAGASAGVAALASAWSRRWILPVTLGIALLAGIVPGVVFLVSGDGSAALGLIPVDTTDAVVLHVVPGLVGLGCLAAARIAPAGPPAA
jgi:hypothetical protein